MKPWGRAVGGVKPWVEARGWRSESRVEVLWSWTLGGWVGVGQVWAHVVPWEGEVGGAEL